MGFNCKPVVAASPTNYLVTVAEGARAAKQLSS